mmetsp:Transcript_16523/g.40708  ORF Transcript_16523/g.40708 Transcript_16523/m.40708 type:complete len:233 (+) Transcript_16523:292-990(+)
MNDFHRVFQFAILASGRLVNSPTVDADLFSVVATNTPEKSRHHVWEYITTAYHHPFDGNHCVNVTRVKFPHVFDVCEIESAHLSSLPLSHIRKIALSNSIDAHIENWNDFCRVEHQLSVKVRVEFVQVLAVEVDMPDVFLKNLTQKIRIKAFSSPGIDKFLEKFHELVHRILHTDGGAPDHGARSSVTAIGGRGDFLISSSSDRWNQVTALGSKFVPPAGGLRCRCPGNMRA